MSANNFDPVTVEDFRELFPEFKDVPDAAIQFELNLAMKRENRFAWGMYWREAVMLSVAHELALQYNIMVGVVEAGKNNPANIGLTTSESVSPGSMSRGSQMPAWMTGDDVLDSYYGRTIYGQRYLILMIRVIPPGVVVFSPQVGRIGSNPKHGYPDITAP